METFTLSSLLDHTAGMHVLQKGAKCWRVQIPKGRRKEAEPEDSPVAQQMSPAALWNPKYFPCNPTQGNSSTKFPPKMMYITKSDSAEHLSMYGGKQP